MQIIIVNGDIIFVDLSAELFNQNDLISLRIEQGVERIDSCPRSRRRSTAAEELTMLIEAEFDNNWKYHKEIRLDIRILIVKFMKGIRNDGVGYLTQGEGARE